MNRDLAISGFDRANTKNMRRQIVGRRGRPGTAAARLAADRSRGADRELGCDHLRSEYGLRAAAVESVGELFSDPQLLERRAWRGATHPVIGEVRLMAPPFVLSDAEQGPTRPGPTLGQHTEEVFRGIVGVSDAEYASLEAAGVFR